MLRTSSRIIPKRLQISAVRLLTTNWYYAIDVPIKGKNDGNNAIKELPKEFKQFTKQDSSNLMEAYKEYITSSDESKQTVKVSEDKLFCVDFKKMELKPIYWDGPAYEVRRGLWFKGNDIPIAAELASEVEELSYKFKKDDPDSGIFELKTKSFDGIKYVLFVSEEEAYLLADLNGGSMHLKVLKSGVGQYLPVNAIRITKFTNEKQKVKTSQSNKEAVKDDDEHVNKKMKTDEQTTSFSVPNSLLSWDFYNQLPSIWNKGAAASENKSSNGLSNNVDSAYDDQDKSIESSYDREIRHLVLSVHGIGQTLGKKYEYVNFAHTINLLRTNMKKLYEVSEDLKYINKSSGYDDWKHNGGVQVLPITWRNSIGFETAPLEENERKSELPTLADVTVKGILPLRQLLGDVGVDCLLYEEPYYRDKILEEVCIQLNEKYQLFKKMNPDFNGDVHLIGHSLGSVILFDLLKDPKKYKLGFDTRKFFCIGSPVGLFKLVQRTRILPRTIHENLDTDPTIDINHPNCEDLYNIFHTCDPVAYRMEPLVHPSMRKVDHQVLPHFTELDGITSKVIQVGNTLISTFPSTEPEQLDKENDKDTEAIKKNVIPSEAKHLLSKLNHLGRVDFAMAANKLEVDMIAAIRSHVSYFEDPDIAGFILKEIIDKQDV
ncbi:probable phospholipase YOR022C, mitochondrial [Monosporozyma unispora]|nr:hypothetical protein C6P44_005072 [Kazachstania unispora]